MKMWKGIDLSPEPAPPPGKRRKRMKLSFSQGTVTVSQTSDLTLSWVNVAANNHTASDAKKNEYRIGIDKATDRYILLVNGKAVMQDDTEPTDDANGKTAEGYRTWYNLSRQSKRSQTPGVKVYAEQVKAHLASVK